MKNFIYTFFIAGIVTLAMSCETVDNPGAINTIDETRTAKITGIVFANINERNDTTSTGAGQTKYEFPPEGTTVFVEVNSADYATVALDDDDDGFEYQTLVFQTTTDANGEFEIDIPALAKFIDADIRSDNFLADQTIEDPDNPGSGTTRRALFDSANDGLRFIEGANYFIRIFYRDQPYNNENDD
ncbi:hypothetical protein FNH22_21445 [Fulvivirga sp. M361]|uniref:hypothetical protein n=1 Tax=Fulvivirga sp. M361 TaxID=2594266 RepID=UPI00117B03C4|nr:hypothetical protein [Fulvivirga sp. M361]TRX53076.1 hypothetical protein FNH22_21445 [Fulvivirga sp. M361]